MFLRRALPCIALLLAVGIVTRAQSAPASWPGGRSCHSMTWASTRSASLVIGGSSACGQQPVRDSAIWQWDGRAWRPITATGPSPGSREDALIAWDDGRNVLVLYGGRRGAVVHEDTWEWNGGAWTQRASGGGPGKVEHAAAAFDAVRGRLVLFGGGFRSGAPMSDDTWEWHDGRWRQVSSGGGPAARVGHSMTWSPRHRAVVMYGGFSDGGSFRDLWRWDGARWSLIDSAGPTPTEGPSLVAGEGEVLTLVGTGAPDGVESGAPLRAWRFAGGRWEAIGSRGPASRVGQALAYDASRRRLVLFGGFRPGSSALDDLWEFDGNVWTAMARR